MFAQFFLVCLFVGAQLQHNIDLQSLRNLVKMLFLEFINIKIISSNLLSHKEIKFKLIYIFCDEIVLLYISILNQKMKII